MVRSAILVLLLLAAGSPAAPGAQPASRLDPEAFEAETLGLSLQLPAGATVTTQIVDDRVIYNVDGGSGHWSMRLEAVRSGDPKATAATMTAQQISSIEGVGRVHRVLRHEATAYGGVEGQLLYVQQAVGEGQSVVNGWLVLPRERQIFLFISVAADPKVFRDLESSLAESFSTITLLSDEELVRRRDSRLDRGRAMVDRLTEERLRSLIGDRQWYRIYDPAGPGPADPEIEIGFMSVQATESERGHLTPERSEGSYGAMESERGLMVMMEARAILDATTRHYLDVQGRYWMSWDRAREAWSVRMTQRQGDVEHTTAETGIRERSRLTVIGSALDQRTRDPVEWTITDKAYLSQPEYLCRGSLFPRDPALAGEMEFFFYDARTRQLPRLVDRWAPAGDGTGNWKLASRSAIEAAETVQIFDAQGRRLRRVDGDGKVTERIDATALRRLWESKGLLTK